VKLLLDAMLGKLATYLRMCGYDAVYALDEGIEDDGEILSRARAADRTLVTRDRELAARADDSICIDSRDIDDQLRELASAGFDLHLSATPERCSECNGELTAVDPATTTPGYAPDPAGTAVWRCDDCGQHFWKGSHWADVRQRLAAIRGG